MLCPVCHQPIDDSTVFCPICGCDVEHSHTGQQPLDSDDLMAPELSESQGKGGRFGMLLVAVVITAVIVLITLAMTGIRI